MKKALFINWSNEAFTHAWNSETETFEPNGAQYEMPDYLAAHYAKHLTNRELIKTGVDQNIRAVSPKEPEKSSIFMKFYNKAFKLLESEEMSEEKAFTKKVAKTKKGTVEITSDIDPS